MRPAVVHNRKILASQPFPNTPTPRMRSSFLPQYIVAHTNQASPRKAVNISTCPNFTALPEEHSLSRSIPAAELAQSF